MEWEEGEVTTVKFLENRGNLRLGPYAHWQKLGKGRVTTVTVANVTRTPTCHYIGQSFSGKGYHWLGV